MDLWTTNEREFRAYVEEHHWDDLDPEVPLLKPSAAEVRIGALILDLVARNTAGGITLVEFKVKASKDALAQLLLYPRAFQKALMAAGCPKVPELRVVLVSPFIDRGVVELVKLIQPPHPIHIRLCVPDGDQRIKLMSPDEPGAPAQHCWEQSEVTGRPSQVGWDMDGGLLIRGERLAAV
ncbi:hypothetical protein [Archangium lansingense]|uniref:Uncharacterized protein n=1 Tax=Archangium lansingense TaxID=2995310 RepID=A0ABT3ZVA6_9BACT|nr:hypothetical protein [Archangium lansinium]MCY1072994.1 hypothetical protein [Archangium lansinium]